MDLNDLIKLAGVAKSADTPVQEQPDGDMRTLIALVTPEQLNQLQSSVPEEAVEEEGYQNSGDHYSGEPEEYKGTLGSPADLSLRRYLGANGMPVSVEEGEVYPDHTVDDITEAWNAYKADPVAEEEAVAEAPYQYDMSDKGDMHDALGDVQNSMDDAVKSIQKASGLASQISDEIENSLYTDESVVDEDDVEEGYYGKKKKKYEAVVDEDDVEEDNAFNTAAAKAKKAGDSHFSFNGKKYKVKMDASTADSLTDDIALLKQLAGI